MKDWFGINDLSSQISIMTAFCGGIIYGGNKLYQAKNIELYKSSTLPIDKEIYARRAGFNSFAYLERSLEKQAMQFQAKSFIGLVCVPVALSVYLVACRMRLLSSEGGGVHKPNNTVNPMMKDDINTRTKTDSKKSM